MTKLTLLMLVALAGTYAVARGDDEKAVEETPRGQNKRIKIDEVPTKFLEVAKKALLGVEWTHAEVNHDSGTHESLTVYEITGTKGGTEMEVDVRADGSVEEVEETIDPKAVPRPVRDLLDGEFPDFKVQKAEKSTRPYRDGSKVVWYELKGTTKADATIDVEVTEDGKYYVIEAD